MRKLQSWGLGGVLLVSLAFPAFGQNDRRGNDGRGDSHAGSQNHGNYYSGMNDHVRGGDYGRAIQRDDSRHHHDNGGIGPGKAALIGGAGGAALGAIFGGGLKGSLIGGAAGAGIGAIGGELAQGNNDRRGRDHR
jgi:hypothetical protein